MKPIWVLILAVFLSVLFTLGLDQYRQAQLREDLARLCDFAAGAAGYDWDRQSRIATKCWELYGDPSTSR